MSVALRRKMFKLGGSTNTHGMGLTSGLKMKKGGSVQASIGAGSGNQPMKMGPDGQMREGHFAPFGALGALFGSGVGMSALRGLAGLGASGLGRFSPQFLKNFGANRQGIIDLIKFGKPSTSRALVPYTGATGSLPIAPGAILRGTGAAGLLGGGPLGLLSLIQTDKDSPRIARAAEAVGEALVDFSPIGLGFSAGDFLFGKPGQDTRSLTEALGLKEKKGVEVDTSKADKIAKIKEKTKEELKAENDQRVQEYYEKLGGEGVDKFAALASGLTAAAPALLEEDFGGAAQRFQEGIQPEIERDRQIRQAAATLAIGDEQAEDAADRELRATLLATGDTDAYTRITKVMDAEEELGIGNVEGLPVKGNNKIDTKKLRRGKIYTDITGATKAKYVVIDKGGMDHYTNSAEEAKQLVELT
jgi:hypothetical protein